MVPPMEDDAITRARLELQRAEAALRDVPGEVGARLAEVLQSVHAALDRLHDIGKQTSEMQRNLAAQQAILDDRLLRVETNRLFAVWNTFVGTGRNVSRRIRRALGVRSTEETKDTGADYAKWVIGEQARLPSLEHARLISAAWAPRPTISVILAVRDGRVLAATLES